MVTVGFAAVASGCGVAYAELRGTDGRPATFVRVGFRCRPLSALCGRDVAYAALCAVATELVRRNVRRVEIRAASADLVEDLQLRRAIPSALIVPYVTLRCTLNRFTEAEVAFDDEEIVHDLTARARAEASLSIAA
ncbi:MAG: hypothetical protein IAI49_09180 [Candidatus Eremiobacteraeota bacterium]|nr:hypothetical protein [Candidatus Eremiobacteraeota bacterium]